MNKHINPYFYLKKQIIWNTTGNVYFLYQTEIDNETWIIRFNGRAKNMREYTLIIDNLIILDFDGWPDAWIKSPYFMKRVKWEETGKPEFPRQAMVAAIYTIY